MNKAEKNKKYRGVRREMVERLKERGENNTDIAGILKISRRQVIELLKNEGVQNNT